MLSANLVLATALGYVALLFAVAFLGDQRARQGRLGWLQSPLVYTLSISVYCTSWTFYGAVGSAARSGLEFATIYLGPTLVFVGWWFLLRKLVRIGRIHRITSIADMISSRYGKSAALAALVTLIAVAASHALHRPAAEGGDDELPGHQRRRRRRAAGFTSRSDVQRWPSGSPPAWRSSRSCSAPATSTPTSATTAWSRRSRSRRWSSWWRIVAVGLLVVFGIGGGPADDLRPHAARACCRPSRSSAPAGSRYLPRRRPR